MGLIHIVAVGDSITRGNASHEPGAGTHAPPKHLLRDRGTYPLELQRLLGDRFNVSNHGHGGCAVVASANDSHRPACAATVEYKAAVLAAPRVTLTMLGTNDNLGHDAAASRLAFEQRLAQLADEWLALPSRPALWLIVPPPFGKAPPRWFAGANRMGLQIQAVASGRAAAVPPARNGACARSSVHLVDLGARGAFADCHALRGRNESLWRSCSQQLYVDDVHPTVLGARELARVLFESGLRDC